MRREYIDERIEFKDEVKQMIYNKARGLCACCGTKLNKNNRSIDHAVPLALGGTNDLRNMIPLCKTCNNIKDSDFYWPGSFYVALGRMNNLTTIREVTDYVLEWVRRWCTKEDIISNPLIARKITAFIVPLEQNRLDRMRKDKLFITPFMWDLTELNRKEDKTEIWERTGINGKMTRRSVNNPKKDYSVYALKKRSNDGWGLLCSAQIMDDNLYITEMWRALGYKMSATIFIFIIKAFYNIWMHEQVGCDKIFITFLDKNSYLEFLSYYMITEFDYQNGWIHGVNYKCQDGEEDLAARWEDIKERTLIIKFVTDGSYPGPAVEMLIDKAKEELRNGGKLI